VVPGRCAHGARGDLGELTVREDGSLTGLYFSRQLAAPDRTAFGARSDERFEKVARQHGEFLAVDRTAFDLPLEVRGREFGRRVWELVAWVPCGGDDDLQRARA
jgi:methylated-DNA-[protein]-cysteine S-methyltransferase